MKTINPFRHAPPFALALAVSLIARSAESPRSAPEEADLRDHVEAELPIHFDLAEAGFKCLGRPVREVHATLILRPNQNLYRPATAEELAASGPELGRFLKLVTRAQEQTPKLKLEFSASAGADGWTFGPLATNDLARLGAPAGAYPNDLLTEDSAAFQSARLQRAKDRKAVTARENYHTATNTLGTLSTLGLDWHKALRGDGGTAPAPAAPLTTSAPAAPSATPTAVPVRTVTGQKSGPTLAAEDLVRGLFKNR